MRDQWLLKNLWRAKRAVMRGERNIQKKEDQIARLARERRDSTHARSMLQTFRNSQKLHEEELARIEAAIEREHV
jgi:hypothetical protein